MKKPKLLGMATLIAIPMTILASMPALADVGFRYLNPTYIN